MASKGKTPTSKPARTCATKPASHESSCLKVMNDFRKEGEFCDVVLVVQGRRFPAHRVVLAAASHFFRLMLTTNMKESASRELELRDVEPEVVEQLTEYLYTARVSVNEGNVQSLLLTADLYQIDPVKTKCLDFLRERINASNCLGVSALADLISCPRLKAKAENFAVHNFTEVVKCSEFLQLEESRLLKLLQHNSLSCSEEKIYEAALLWLKHDLSNRRQHLEEVLSCVCFPLIPHVFLSETVQHEPLVQNNQKCLRMLISGLTYYLSPSQDHKDLSMKIHSRLKPMLRVAVLQTTAPKLGHSFNPRNYSLTSIGCDFWECKEAVAVYCNGLVYMLSGWNGWSSRGTRCVDCYSVGQKIWFSKPELPRPRVDLAACASRGKIYVSGGTLDCGRSTCNFDCFNTETNLWQTEPNMLNARSCHASVADRGLVYICGGWNQKEITNRFEVYNPNTQQWTELRPMRQARKNHGLVVVQNRIYAVGGQGPQGFLKSIEGYDLVTEEWCDCASMPHPQAVKCAAVGGIIYVLACKTYGTGRKPVLEYHTKTDRQN
ncbi:kelch-like protein 7 isoform X2 [Nematolebias whitei]|uniref:kelch-like protein 7 isoform X2 n=1 Tax=Nematolebias whitei TaxID=451745 RepID=UPI0018982259|nr:kelch-like protein 7 isoform X2 [Nematolebias whitei]